MTPIRYAGADEQSLEQEHAASSCRLARGPESAIAQEPTRERFPRRRHQREAAAALPAAQADVPMGLALFIEQRPGHSPLLVSMSSRSRQRTNPGHGNVCAC